MTLSRNLRGWFVAALSLLLSGLCSSAVRAAYQSRFEIITFKPTFDTGEYFSVYSSQNLRAWQGSFGVYFDFANRPLQFVATPPATGRQSVVDNLLIADFAMSLGFFDWMEVGLNLPIVMYNWFFTDNALAQEDHGGGLGDMAIGTKIRIINTENSLVGFSVLPFFTLPSGDIVRYTGNGHPTGGLTLITDFIIHRRFSLGLNVGATFRDDVTLHGVRIDDQFNYGLAGNVKITENFQAIAEMFGRTTMRRFYQNSAETPLEGGVGLRAFIGDTGFAGTLGGTIGIIDGVGSPRFRGFAGLQWISRGSPKECPECPPPAPPPDPRISGNKIVIWGKIFFDTDKAVIKEISYPVLDDVVDVMRKNPQLRIVEVQGHCDVRGSDEYNQKLSQERAESSMRYLIDHGVESSRLTARGYGRSQPIADNSTVEGMSQNRRVEFVILEERPYDAYTPQWEAPPSEPSNPYPESPPSGTEAPPVYAPEPQYQPQPEPQYQPESQPPAQPPPDAQYPPPQQPTGYDYPPPQQPSGPQYPPPQQPANPQYPPPQQPVYQQNPPTN